MDGGEYKRLVAAYIFSNFRDRGIRIHTEVGLGTTIIGKDRRADILVLCDGNPAPLVLECKWQESGGTTDEKVPYVLQDLATLRVPGCLVYGGPGFSKGVLHLLRSSRFAAYCYPHPQKLDRGAFPRRGDHSQFQTWELDHVLAMTFGWWDVIIGTKPEFGKDDLTAVQKIIVSPPTRPVRAAKRADGSLPEQTWFLEAQSKDKVK